MDTITLLNFIENIQCCHKCPGSDEGCAVCGQWYPYSDYWNMSEYKMAVKLCNTVAQLTNTVSNESWRVKLSDVRIILVNKINDNTVNGICYYEYAGDDPVYFFCKIK